MGRKAFDGEGAYDADGVLNFVGFVVGVFPIGFGGDRGVDFLLSFDAGVPEVGEGLGGGLRPVWGYFAGDFPCEQAVGRGGFTGREGDGSAGGEVYGFALVSVGFNFVRGLVVF